MSAYPIELMKRNELKHSSGEGGGMEKQSYYRRLYLGVLGAAITSIPLSMGVTIFDRSVIQVVNGSREFLGATVKEGFVAAARNPVSIFLTHDNRALFIVYGSTYVANKSMLATSEYRGWNPFLPVLATTTVVNTVLGIFKDRYLAQMFGSGVPNFPRMSYSLFTARDIVIVGSSFNLPPYLSPVIQDNTSLSKSASDTIAQLACPGLAQIGATPLHILGLDHYNRPGLSWRERFHGLAQRSWEPLGVRMMRQIYVFGVGSLAVRKVCDVVGFNEPMETLKEKKAREL